MGSIVGIFLGILVFKKPHLSVSLERIQMSLYNDEQEDQKISMLIAHVVNTKKRLLGDTAKGVTGSLVFRADIPNDKSIGLNAATGLPWLQYCTPRNKVSGKLRNQENILQVLEQELFNRDNHDIPQGRAETLVVSVGIEKSNKMFFPSKTPMELNFPPPDKPRIAFMAYFINLEFAGENLPSTPQAGTLLSVKSWDDWNIPTKVELISTPSRWDAFLMALGVKRAQQKIIAVRTATQKS